MKQPLLDSSIMDEEAQEEKPEDTESSLEKDIDNLRQVYGFMDISNNFMVLSFFVALFYPRDDFFAFLALPIITECIAFCLGLKMRLRTKRIEFFDIVLAKSFASVLFLGYSFMINDPIVCMSVFSAGVMIALFGLSTKKKVIEETRFSKDELCFIGFMAFCFDFLLACYIMLYWHGFHSIHVNGAYRHLFVSSIAPLICSGTLGFCFLSHMYETVE